METGHTTQTQGGEMLNHFKALAARFGEEKTKARARAWLGSVALGRGFNEDFDAYLDRTGKREEYEAVNAWANA